MRKAKGVWVFLASAWESFPGWAAAEVSELPTGEAQSNTSHPKGGVVGSRSRNPRNSSMRYSRR